VEIRRVLEDDKADWMRLFRAYGMFYKSSIDDDVMHRVWAWLTDDSHSVSGLVALDDGVVIGFAHYTRLSDTFTGGPEWFLDDLYVESFARGKGTATALIDGISAHAAANGGGKIRWITASDNTTAQSLYDKVAKRTTWVTYEKPPIPAVVS
jgi:ribosomal protein S18 acetylase RimI-like enzyme